MSGRKWTVEEHPQKAKIIKAIVKGDESLRSIAARFDIPATNVKRYLNEKLLDKAAAVLKEKDRTDGQTLIDELLARDKRVEKLFDACERYLQDADKPDEYNLFPRAWEFDVQYRVTDEDGATVYRKESMQALIDRMNKSKIVPIEYRYKHADPRKLLLDTANTLKGTMELRAKLAGRLVEGGMSVTINQNYLSFKSIILKATEGHPDVRAKIVEELEKMGEANAG